MTPDVETIVALPACNEAELIGRCLISLDRQRGAQLHHIVLLANNCTDATVAAARAVPLRPGTQLHIEERQLHGLQANAGTARRLAMQAARQLCGTNGILLTTDADGCVFDDWLAETLTALHYGPDAVAGCAELDPEDHARIPARLHQDDARECRYDLLCDEIHARLDPDPYDPWPRHTQASGASIAIRAALFVRCGGVPDVACGEDRALMAALRRIDARIRHSPRVRVMVSGRIEGRATGGMADTIRRRLQQPDEFIDDRLEPAEFCARRASARQAARQVWLAAQIEMAPLARLTGMTEAALESVLRSPHFGVAWELIEQAAPRLRRVQVRAADLEWQTRRAQAMLVRLRQDGGTPFMNENTLPAVRPIPAA